MTLGRFRELTKSFADNVPVVTPGDDHSYNYAHVTYGKAEFDHDGYIGEPADEETGTTVIIVG